MAMFLALNHMGVIYLNSFDLIEHLAKLQTLILAINFQIRNFLNKTVGIINFAKPYLHFIVVTMI